MAGFPSISVTELRTIYLSYYFLSLSLSYFPLTVLPFFGVYAFVMMGVPKSQS